MRIESVEVTPDAVEAIVRFTASEPLRTSEVPNFAGAVIAALPGLRGHRCDNGAGLTFADELRDTELAHVIEHAALEVMALAGSPATLRGTTSWDFTADGRGVFRVRLAYDDDLVAIGALRFAGSLVEGLAKGERAPDAVAEARRLRALRGR